MQQSSPNVFLLHCSFHWWKQFCSDRNSLLEKERKIMFMLRYLRYVNARDSAAPNILTLAEKLVLSNVEFTEVNFTFHVWFSLLIFTKTLCINTSNTKWQWWSFQTLYKGCPFANCLGFLFLLLQLHFNLCYFGPCKKSWSALLKNARTNLTLSLRLWSFRWNFAVFCWR